MKKFIFSIFILFIFTNLQSQTQDSGEPGAFLKNGFSARANAMGQAFVSIADDASAIFYNPGGMINIKSTSITGMYSKLFNDVDGVNYGTFGIVNNFDFGIVGFGVVYMSVNDIPYVENETGPTGINFNSNQSVFYLSYTKYFLDNLNIGGSFKFLNQSLAEYSGSGWGLDLGVYSNVNKNITVGLLFQDLIAPKVKINNSEDVYNTKVKFGFVYKPIPELKISPEAIFETGKDEIFAIGAEYLLFKDILAIRSGYNTTYNSFSAGAGIKYKYVALDYSFNTHKYLGNVNRFGLRLDF
ncbi:MAG TPA: PorV/PorQ family protein [Ignavibacteria bacterium]|nr:PorV/PorQ family protein [Ignavibacteria bacterium]